MKMENQSFLRYCALKMCQNGLSEGTMPIKKERKEKKKKDLQDFLKH